MAANFTQSDKTKDGEIFSLSPGNSPNSERGKYFEKLNIKRVSLKNKYFKVDFFR